MTLLYDLRFAQVAETKLHEVDERLDEIEQIVALYEAKLELDEEIFASMPEVSQPLNLAIANTPEIVTRTENPL